MVLGLRSKKGTSVSVEFLIHLQEIKPWPIARSSKSAPSPSVILQWERGDKHSGSTKSVAPSPGQGNDGFRLVFNEHFRLPATLYKEPENKSSKSSKSSHDQGGKFQKKSVVFSLIAVKGQTLARAVLDLAEYAALDSAATTAIPLTAVRKGLLGTGGSSPHLFLGIAPYNKGSLSVDGVDQGHHREASSVAASASSRGFNPPNTKVEPELDDESRESLVAALMSDEDEIASFTDDDDEDSPRSSTTHQSDRRAHRNPVPSTVHSPSPNVEDDQTRASGEGSKVENKVAPVISSLTSSNVQQTLPVKSAAAAAASAYASKKSMMFREDNSSRGSSVDLSSEPMSPRTEDFLTPSSLGAQSPAIAAKIPTIPPLSSPLRALSKVSPAISGPETTLLETGSPYEIERNKNMEVLQKDLGSYGTLSLNKEEGKVSKRWTKAGQNSQADAPTNSAEYGKEECNLKENHNKEEGHAVGTHQEKLLLEGVTNLSSDDLGVLKRKNDARGSKEVNPKIKKDAQVQESKDHSLYLENQMVGKGKGESESLGGTRCKALPGMDLEKPKVEDREEEVNIIQAARMKFAMGSEERNEKLERKAFEETKIKLATAEAKVAAADSKVKELETRIQNLEGELIDAAAVEVSLYSVVAQHGSSPHKVHSPARRMARLYIHACKTWSQDRRASCARSCVSGLVLVARACGNDVTRLSFWLSNVVVLREMILQAFELSPASPKSPELKAAKSDNVLHKNDANANSPITERKHGLQESQSGYGGAAEKKNPLADWREANTFVVALERVEGWIFGRIIESVWWQALTPPMQQSAELSLGSSSVEDGLEETKPSEVQKEADGFLGQELGENHQGNLCLELWKSAFLDVLQRICPVRAGGHECGCLRCLIKMILEQCLARLDVAMFNAILRDPDEWAPMDPIADPIVDPSVLPIPAGRLTFGGGAQLKNAIRTWSTWLAAFTTGHRSIVDDNTGPHPESTDGTPNENEKVPALFTLLRAMADLLMLPKDMLMDKSVRREVCPTLSLPLIKKILANFVPDEFSPDPVTPSLLAALTAEIAMEKRMQGEVDTSSASPSIVTAPHVQYAPPPSSCVRELIGDATNHPRFGRSSSSLLRKGHTSDDELEELEVPLSFMLDSAPSRAGRVDVKTSQSNGSCDDIKDPKMEAGYVRRFQLLKEVWYSH
ncbi:hypothetical protein O6H91_18G025500 [Diphasiastrum complanatum]|uniref:Uncharacterized protein n=2 Tax=Diphasiastrum complanatum TaxID=34168 RepID=A0ACC2AZ19_DIPCM|nr:hypothetical protein O6H91_18G025500 [Diphasiastrum complanatum]KAJ7522764.1 hypothetical protein O6H91_18G025500 [Diphasiastrum complanatum]